MSRYLSNFGLAFYVLVAGLALIWWAPHFFAANLHTLPQFNYRYITATGIPFSLLLITVAARQSLMPRFSLVLVLQSLVSGLVLVLALISFQFLRQGVFFCALHLALCAVFFLWNLKSYRRELGDWKKRRAALSA